MVSPTLFRSAILIVVGLLIGMGIAFMGFSQPLSKTLTTTRVETIRLTIVKEATVTSLAPTTYTTILEKTRVTTAIKRETVTETTTLSLTKVETVCGAPYFTIAESDDPNIDFYVKLCGDTIVSKARTQLWNYRFIPGDEMNYVHLLVGYITDDEWRFAEGFEDKVDTKLLSSGRYLEWTSHLHENTHDFDSRAHVKMFTVSGYLVIEVNASLMPRKNFENVVDLYVEFGRKSGGFKWVATRVGEKVIIQDMIHTGEERYVSHYFEDLKISRYGWIAGRTLDNSSTLALIFKSAKIISEDGNVMEVDRITPVALDTAGHYDAIELHLIEADWENPETLKKGYTYELDYYILASEEKGYEWIDKLIDLLNSP